MIKNELLPRSGELELVVNVTVGDPPVPSTGVAAAVSAQVAQPVVPALSVRVQDVS